MKVLLPVLLLSVTLSYGQPKPVYTEFELWGDSLINVERIHPTSWRKVGMQKLPKIIVQRSTGDTLDIEYLQSGTSIWSDYYKGFIEGAVFRYNKRDDQSITLRYKQYRLLLKRLDELEFAIRQMTNNHLPIKK